VTAVTLLQNSDACAGFGIQIEGDSGRNIVSNNIFVNVAQKADMQAIVLAGEAVPYPSFLLLVRSGCGTPAGPSDRKLRGIIQHRTAGPPE